MDKTKHEEIADAWVGCNKAWQERDALAAELAALKKRITDAPKSHTFQTGYGFVALPARGVEANGTYALLRLEDGE